MNIKAFAIAASLLCPSLLAHAGLPTIDDFSTARVYRPTPDGITDSTYLSAGIAGGARTLTTYVNANAYKQYSAIGIGMGLNKATVAPGLYLNTGYGVAQRVDVGYGIGKAMSLNLSKFGRFRVHFSNASIISLADFQAFTGGTYMQWGCNAISTNGADPTHEITVDYPFTPAAGLSYAKITRIYLILQSNANVAVNKIEVVPAKAPAADFTCPAG